MMDDDSSNSGNASNVWVGVLGVAVASIVWGSCFIVCKGYDLPQDGVHFSFLMSVGILLVGLATLFSSEVENGDFEAVFSPEGLIGGGFWACGNFLTVSIIGNVGLGIGLALWAGTNMVVAFLVGAIGLEKAGIDLPKEPLQRPICGVFGVALAIAALVVFATVKPDGEMDSTTTSDNNDQNFSEQEREPRTELLGSEAEEPRIPTPESDNLFGASEPLLQHFEVSNPSTPQLSLRPYGSDHEEEEEARHRRRVNTSANFETDGDASHKNIPLGVFMAVVAGTLYGFQFVPLSMWNAKVIRNGHIFDHPLPSDTIRSLRFFFSQFAGIFLTAFVGFVLYCLYTGNRPKLVPPEATLPSILCGAVWATGCAGAMLATSGLGNAVGFPLLLNCSFLVNSAWSILVFKEIQGTRNLRLFGFAFELNVISSILISLAKG